MKRRKFLASLLALPLISKLFGVHDAHAMPSDSLLQTLREHPEPLYEWPVPVKLSRGETVIVDLGPITRGRKDFVVDLSFEKIESLAEGGISE